jgi:phytoene synthase
LEASERSAYLLAEARTHDPDRYLCALFVPAERRGAVLALILLNRELARVPELVSQPMAGYIRHQWWREAIAEAAQGTPRAHPVVEELAPALRRGWIEAAALQALVDARERDLEAMAPEDLDALERYVGATSGALGELIYRAGGGGAPGEAAAARDLGTALGLVGIVRAVGAQARRNRQLLPEALLAEAGVKVEEIARARMSEGLGRAVEALLARAEALLAQGRQRAGRPPQALMGAFLSATLAEGHLRQIRGLGSDPFRAGELRQPALAPLRLLWRAGRRRP